MQAVVEKRETDNTGRKSEGGVMKGADRFALLFKKEQIGQMFVCPGSHARGLTFGLYVLDDGYTVAINEYPKADRSVLVYGMVSGQRGWTEAYDWIKKGPWVEDFMAEVQRREERKKELESERQRNIVSEYTDKRAREQSILETYKGSTFTRNKQERIMENRNADSALSVAVEGEELVIRIGINRMDGDDCHPELPALKLPALKFKDRQLWIKDVIYEIERQKEDGSCPISDLLDKAMSEAIEQGSAGITEDSPTHVGVCSNCEEPFMPLRWFKDGDQCPECIGDKRLRHTKLTDDNAATGKGI